MARNTRKNARKSVFTANHIPAGMELFKAGNESQLQTIFRWIDECDLFYYCLEEDTGPLNLLQRKAIQLEYEYALKNNILVFAIVLSDRYLYNKAATSNFDVFETNNIKNTKYLKGKN